jgi:hypothetical protein
MLILLRARNEAVSIGGRFRQNKRRLGFWLGVHGIAGGKMAELSQFSIVTYERRPGHWRAAITPVRQPAAVMTGKTITSIVTPDDFASETDARFAAEKIIRKL